MTGRILLSRLGLGDDPVSTPQYQSNPIDAETTIRELEDQFRAAFGEQRLRVVVAPDVNELCTDEDKPQRVLTNLVEDAVKYAPDGPIELRCAKVDGGTRCAEPFPDRLVASGAR